MRNLFKSPSAFYFKTLILYGTVVAFFYCSSLQREQKYASSDQLDVVEECPLGVLGALEEQSGYPYAKMINLIEQCRSIEAEFHRHTIEFVNDSDEKIDKVKELFLKVDKLKEKLRQEQGSFLEYIAASRFQAREDPHGPYVCAKGRCSCVKGEQSARSTKDRRKKSANYMCQVLNRYVERMEIISYSLGRLVEEARLRDELAKGRSEAAAKQKAGVIPPVKDI